MEFPQNVHVKLRRIHNSRGRCVGRRESADKARLSHGKTDHMDGGARSESSHREDGDPIAGNIDRSRDDGSTGRHRDYNAVKYLGRKEYTKE